MPVIARDAVASDHLVYAWPFPIGPEEYEVSCSEDEQVVMCPSWVVADRLGPGRHRWRTQDPSRPVSAYFVLVAPVEVSFDLWTTFVIPTTGQPVRLRSTGSLQVRCADPGLLVAQFVGLPFDQVNDGVLRSVARSIERMLARLLTRRVVMAGTPAAVTDPSMLSGIVEELVAYNPAAGAVFGVELVRMGHLSILADDGSQPLASMRPTADWSGGVPRVSNGDHARAQSPTAPPPFAHTPSHPDIPMLETVRAPRHQSVPPVAPPPVPAPPPMPERRRQSQAPTASGEIVSRSARPPSNPPPAPHRVITTPVPPPAADGGRTEDITSPGLNPVPTPAPGTLRAPAAANEARGSIMGIGMAPIGSTGGVASGEIGGNKSKPTGKVASTAGSAGGMASGEIPSKIAPGGRVLVPGPNGLLQSATVRQLLQGYYELEVGGSGETIWVPINGVVPE